MNRFLLSVALFLCLISCESSAERYGNRLEKGFVEIPDTIQTSVYWYWISGHVSKEGVVKDLHAMKEAGINRAFIGDIWLGGNVGDVEFQSDEWWEAMHLALKTATELDIEIGIFNTPGWSQSGGPWVKSEQAMRYLASTMTNVKGGQKIDIELSRPESPHNSELDYEAVFQDVKVIAYPAINVPNSVLNSENCNIKASKGVSDIKNLIDGNLNTLATLVPVGKPAQDVTIDLNAKSEFTLRSVKIYPDMNAINTTAQVQVCEGGEYKTITSFRLDRYNFALHVGFNPDAPIVLNFAAVKGRDFRLVIDGVNGGTKLRQIELSSIPSVERYPEKSLAKMFQQPLPYWDQYMWDAQSEVDDESLIVAAESVVDLSSKLQGDRLVVDDLPEGDWVIVRTGMYPTGVSNAPAGKLATGLEIDKMSKKHVESHFEAYMGEIIRRIPAEDRKTWKVIVQDSYETGGQNFTDGFLEEFEVYYGYDPVPFLPVFEGVVVESQNISDRFLWDIRRLVANKVAYDYVGGLRDVSHKYGMKTWLENYGHWGFPGEFLMYGGQSDEIGGEFWSEGELGDIENRAATSCGHIYNKQKISAESFTAAGRSFQRVPADMKQRGDRFSAEGINNTLLHVYILQAYEDRLPGVNAWFGNEFNRKNTWFSDLKIMLEYFKRSNYMLQQGLNVADVAYFIGEDAPKMIGVTDPTLPKGYQFDYINAEVILRDMYVKDGLLTLPHGTQYKVLVLPKQETMRPAVLLKIKALIEAGATVLGPEPTQSPSYQDYPKADAQLKSIAKSLWGNIDSETKYAKIGKGILADDMSMEEVFALIGTVPDFKLNTEEDVHFGHRTAAGVEIYFVTNQSGKPISISPEFRVKDMQPEAWDAIHGTMRDLPAFEQTETGVVVPLKLDINESLFLVFRKGAGTAASNSVETNYPTASIEAEFSTPWSLTFKKDFDKRGPSEPVIMKDLIDLTTHDDYDIKHYAGTVLYSNTFKLDKLPTNNSLALNLTFVTAAAKVYINGKYAGGAWTYPYKVDITDLVNVGENKLEVEVSTVWHNRIIGDLKLPESERQTWSVVQPYNADTPLQKSGLIGPVVVESVIY